MEIGQGRNKQYVGIQYYRNKQEFEQSMDINNLINLNFIDTTIGKVLQQIYCKRLVATKYVVLLGIKTRTVLCFKGRGAYHYTMEALRARTRDYEH